jgi:hypothetical protein
MPPVCVCRENPTRRAARFLIHRRNLVTAKGEETMKLMLSALAGGLLLGAAISSPAEARCWWNGWTWVCAPRYYYNNYYRPYPRYYRYRPYYRYRYY